VRQLNLYSGLIFSFYKRVKIKMKIELSEKPRPGAIIIEGFPGFGFVSTIATEYIIKHINAKPIGRIMSYKLSPLVAIHKSEIIEPLQILYDADKNIVIVQAVVPVNGIEWEIAETLLELAKEIKAKEIIGLEGVISQQPTEKPNAFFYTNIEKNKKKLEGMDLKNMTEGVIIGVTGALLLKCKETDFSCFFVETHSDLPDNTAAARLIEILDKYINLGVDYQPLIDKAKEFEEKLKGFMSKLSKVKQDVDKNHLTYTG
jgi:predicted ATP-grasp superfamily ATP-dependent carboligase